MRVQVVIRDKVGKDFRVEEKRRVEIIKEQDLERIAKRCEKVIQQFIMEKTKMPTGKLASMFYAEKIVDGWGIGDVAELDDKTPYWNHLDKGSQGIGANWDHYLPKGFWVNGRWVESPNGYSGIKPKTPIQAINYIDSTLATMELEILQILKEQ